MGAKMPIKKRFRYNRKPSRCFWCGRQMAWRTNSTTPRDTLATREHVKPRSQGGGGGANLVAACAACNQRRGTQMDWVPFRSGFEAMPPAQQVHVRSVKGAVRGVE